MKKEIEKVNSKKHAIVRISDLEQELNELKDEKLRGTGPTFGERHVQIALLCVAMIVGISMRANLSVAVVAMTDPSTSPNTNVPTYDWQNTSVILSSFFWSYICFQMIAGYLGKTYGPKYFLLAGFFVNCVACTLIPVAAEHLGSTGVILCRIFQGFGQGFLYPSNHVMLGRWAPVEERSTLGNIVFSGVTLGTIMASMLTGIISSSWLGWPVSFYIFGGLGFAWCCIWAVLGQNSPATHPRITMEEKKYIQASLEQDDDEVIPIPWKDIFSSLHFWALVIASIGNVWGYAVIMTEIPTYLASIMKFDVKSNGILNSIPYAVALLSGLVIGPVSDFVIGKKYLSTLSARRIFHVVGSYGQAFCLIALAYLDSSQANLSIVLLSIANCLTAGVMVGSAINHLDISPRFSGIIFGFSNGVSQIFSIIAPLTVQFIVVDKTDVSLWRIVFIVSAGFYIVASTIFAVFASATRQPWDGPCRDKMERMKKISVVIDVWVMSVERVKMSEKCYLEKEYSENVKNTGPIFGKRHGQAILLFFCLAIEMATRSCLSLSIVAMTDNTTSINPETPTYSWKDTNIILSSFYWGYVILQVLAGQMGKTHGPKWFLFGAMCVNSLATALIPYLAEFLGSKGVMICRITQGLSQGFFFPNTHTMLGRWAPENERSRMATFVYTGVPVGIIVCLPVTGVIAQSYMGWPVAFYLFGSMGFLWCFAWIYFGYDSPATHPHITEGEKKYIELSLNQHKDAEDIPTPWKDMFTSIHFWAIVVGTLGAGWGNILLTNEMPTYLKKAMGYSTTSSGLLTSLTSGAGIISNFVYGPIADYIIDKKIVSRLNARRIFHLTGCYGCTVTMMVLAYLLKSEANLSIIFLTLSSTFGSAILFGVSLNPIDISPRFSGVILGFSNATSSAVSLFAPLLVQFIVTDETNATEWRTVFLLAAGWYLIPATFFAVFASGERQWWDSGSNKITNLKNIEKKV